MSGGTPQAVQACHQLIRWLISQLDKLPRLRRFTLGERLEQALLEVLELLLDAAYTRAKQLAASCGALCATYAKILVPICNLELYLFTICAYGRCRYSAAMNSEKVGNTEIK